MAVDGCEWLWSAVDELCFASDGRGAILEQSHGEEEEENVHR